MPEPNPILGIHAAPLATAWTQVRREADGSFRVLAWGIEAAPTDPAEAVAAAAEIAVRRPFRGRGTYIALPDGSGCVVTAVLPPEELDLTGDDLVRELHEHTPFEPGVASLRNRQVRVEGRRREILVAALPVAQERRFAEAVAKRDDGTFGLGFAGTTLLRGVAALGLAPRAAFVLEMLPRTTHLYATDEHRVQRYLVAAGSEDVTAAAAAALGRDTAALRAQVQAGTTDAATDEALARAAQDIAEDARSFATYHVAQRYAPKDPPDGIPAPEFVAAGASLDAAPLRRALAAHLGARVAETAPRAEPGVRITWDQPPGAKAPALAGAVGAALEAFAPAEERLALRAPPRDLPEVPDVARRAVPAAVIAVLALAGAAWWYATQGPGAGEPSVPRDPGTRVEPPRLAPAVPVEDAARAVALLNAADTIADVTDSACDVGAARLEWSGEGYLVTLRITVTGPARPPVVARLAPGVESETWSAGRGGGDPTTYEARWFVRTLPVPAEDALGRDAAPRLGAALDAWRATRKARARALGGTISTEPNGARLVEVPGGSIAGAVALADAGDVIDAAARRSQDRGSWLDTSVVSGTADAVAAVRARRGEDAVRSGWADGAEPPAAQRSPGDPDAFGDHVAAALRAPAPRTVDRWARDLALVIGPADDGAKLQWTGGGARTLQRRDPGDAAWIDAADLGGDGGERAVAAADLPPCRRWRLIDSGIDATRAGVSVEALPTRAARAEIARAVAGAPGVRLRLVSEGTAGRVTAEAAFAPGDAIRAQVEGTRLVLDAGCKLTGSRVRDEEEPVRISVPRFLPDGRVERTSDGRPVRVERETRRPARWLDVDAEDAAGNVRRLDSRKMTDG